MRRRRAPVELFPEHVEIKKLVSCPNVFCLSFMHKVTYGLYHIQMLCLYPWLKLWRLLSHH
jgi:hypothetical protein